MKKLMIFGTCVLIMFCASACGGNGGDVPDGGDNVIPEPPVDNTVYENVVESPACPVIDESDYTVYYFDAEAGSDSNNGLSEATAKKSTTELSRLASAAREPSKFLLKAGTTFVGNVSVSGYVSTAEKPLIFDRYGSENGYPLVQGAGGAAFYVTGDNVRIRNLEIVNPKGAQGILVAAGKDGENTGVVIEGCYVHDVCWNWTDESPVEDVVDRIGNYNPADICSNEAYHYSTSGIYLSAPNPNNSTTPRWFDKCWILNNKVKTVGRCGIFAESSWVSGNGCQWGGKNKFRSLDDGWYPAKNLVISGNEVSYIGGDGILVIGAEDTFIEYNTCLHAGLLGRAGQAIAGIWFINARRVYVQFNEAGYTHLENGCTDGEGFDIDIGCSDSVFQYNYSHDNAGGGLLICNVHADAMPEWDERGNPVIDPATGEQKTFVSPGYWNNNIIRNNLFACNGRDGTKGAFINASSDCKNIICENNTVIFSPDIYSQNLIHSADYGQCGMQENFVCRNNVFYAASSQYMQIDLTYCDSYIFENNLYYNFPETFFDKWTGIEDSKAIREVNPQITIPENRIGYDKIAEFRPTNAQVFSLGMSLQSLSVRDILGTDTNGKKYVGAFCG